MTGRTSGNRIGAAPSGKETTATRVRELLLGGNEVALLDVRDEAVYASGHPLWAANLPLSALEFDAPRRIPRRAVPLIVYGDGDLAAKAVDRLRHLGYTEVSTLTDGLAGWSESGGELFSDVNVPSKAFGELVAESRRTPSLDADSVLELIESGADVVVVDVRTSGEYQTMSIPTATNVPGGELVLRIRTLAPDPGTHVIVNCAGRTRSIIGTQSLINSGFPNPVAALSNGTIGWVLSGRQLDHGAHRYAPRLVDPEQRTHVAAGAKAVAERAGARWIRHTDIATLNAGGARTVYRFDVRTSAEFDRGHLPGFSHAPGGQLIQETDHWAPVRGARVVLTDDDAVRAPMTGSWLAQMGWEVWIVDDATAADRSEIGPPHARTDRPASTPCARYRRPYEGTDNPHDTMRAYLEWEYGLVDQLERDGTHGFKII